MLKGKDIVHFLSKHDVRFYCGVPDSVLKEFCMSLSFRSPSRHIITANEGGAIALAAGYYLASGKIPLVYMQNAGLGNAVNPLTSLANKEVYRIPMILLIGWRGEPHFAKAPRGEPGQKDEPQHRKEGEVTLPLLKLLDMPHVVLSDVPSIAEKQIAVAVKTAKRRSTPYALLARKGTFEL